MIKQLISKNKHTISRLEVEEHIREIETKRQVVYSLLKEIIITEEPGLEEYQSPLPVLCESYVGLLRLTDMLNKILIDVGEKPYISFKSEEVLIYIAFFQNLVTYEKELRHLYYISLTPKESNV